MAGKEIKPQEVIRQQALQKYEDIKKDLAGSKIQQFLQAALSGMMNPQRYINILLTYVRQREDVLQECDKASILATMLEICKLQLDPVLKEVYIVPYWNSKRKVKEAQMRIDYRGKIHLVMNTGKVKKVKGYAVYSNDELEVSQGTEEYIRHRPSKGPRGEIVGAYCVVTYKDDTTSQEYMDIEEIKKREAVSPTMQRDKDGKVARDENGDPIPMDGTPWKEWFADMSIKTVLHHHLKQVPMSAEVLHAEELDDRAYKGESQIDIIAPDISDLIDNKSEISPVIIFDQKVEKAISLEDRPLFDEYLKKIAEKYKTTVDEMKVQLKDEFEGVILAFQKYKEKQKLLDEEREFPSKEEELEAQKKAGMISEKK
jgi:recombination protein RecT